MKTGLIALVLALMPFFLASPAYSASQDECAVWLCLPGGFPSGCEVAHSAMRDRVKHGKPPLPEFASCAVNPPAGSGSHMSYAFGYAAFIPGYRVRPDRYIKGTRCRRISSDSELHPRGCTHTVRWTEVYVDGALAGSTYYW